MDRKTFWSGIGAVVLVALACGAGAAESPYPVSPTFAPAQAEAGAAVYATRCSGCHGKNLDDGAFAPPLIGETFLQKWGAKRASALVTYIATQMPPTATGTITHAEAVELLALILQGNRVHGSSNPLPLEEDGLANIQLPSPTNAFGELEAGVALPPPPTPPSNRLERMTPVTTEMLRHVPAGDWLTWRRTPDDKGYSPLRQINRSNVSRMQIAWGWALGNGPNEATPLVHDGVMFLYSFDDTIQALDAKTGDFLWQYTRQSKTDLPFLRTRKSIAIYGTRLYTLTSDGHLVAINAKTGQTAWDIVPEPASTHFWFTSGPLIANGNVVFGTGGFQPGGNFVMAFDTETGQERWRFRTIPEPGQPGGNSWNGVEHDKRSGAGVWTPGSFDPDLNLVFFGPGNTYDTGPLRNRVADTRYTNDALYTDTTLALDATTGQLRWSYQHSNNDQWDHDWAFERQIIDLPVQGKTTKTVVTAGKTAIHDVLDAATGKYLYSIDLGLQNLVTAIDPVTGHKTVDETKVPGDGQPKLVCPHVEGGKNWTPSSYDPVHHTVFVALVESCMNMTPVGPNGHGLLSTGVQVGLQPRAGSDGLYGRLEALDLVTRKSRWVHRERAPLTSGTMATAGELVFAGFMDRNFSAFDGVTGRKLWSVRLNEVPNSNSISYEVDGEQYIAVVVGMGGNHSRLFTGLVPEIKNPANRSSSVWVFKLPAASPMRH